MSGTLRPVTPDRHEFLGQIDAATGRLLETLRSLTASELRQPSLLPGWSRGHVLTHVARSADAMRNLLTWARTGIPTPAYPSPEAREAAIRPGANRDAAGLLADLTESARAFRDAALALPGQAWQVQVQVRVLDSAQFPASELLVRRLVEVELHHTDLDTGYRPADWSPGFTRLQLPEPMRSQREDRLTWFAHRR